MSRTPIKRQFQEQNTQTETGLQVVNAGLSTIPQAAIEQEPDIITALSNVIEKQLKRGREIREEIKLKTDELNSRFWNDPQYKDADQKVSLAQDKRKNEKARMMGNREIYALDSEIKDKRRELRELKKSHSDYLQEYRRNTQLNMFELSDGTQCEMVDTTKLVLASNAH
jgi:hypothetical protein